MLKKLTKVLSLLLILCLMVSMFPAVALADEGTEAPVVTETPEETTPVVTPVPEESSAPVESPVPSETPAVEASPAPSDTPVDNTSAAGDEPAADDEPASDEPGDFAFSNKTDAEDGIDPLASSNTISYPEKTQSVSLTGDFRKIVMVDAGRKYFTADWIIALINEMAADGYTTLCLAVGNDGLRFLLNDMSVTVGDTTYSSADVTAAIKAGNKTYHDFGTNELTQSEMDKIFAAAGDAGIEIIPLINTPGHMDAILSAATSLTGTTCSYNGSRTTIDVTNATAVNFTYALLEKYVAYFAAKGCKAFNIGCDEYANDVYTTGGMGFGNLQSTGKYASFVKYVNGAAALVQNRGLAPICFNDGIYYNNVKTTAIDSALTICYWSSGWSGYTVRSAANLSADGFKLINTHGDFYYVLGKSDKFDSGYSYASNWSNTTFYGSSDVTNETGSMFCIWCDYPAAETETEIAQKVRLPLRAMAAAMAGNDATAIDTETVVSGGFNADGSLNVVVETVTKTDETTGISVTAPGLTGLNVALREAASYPGTASLTVGYDITPVDVSGNYDGDATVTVPVPAEMTDTSRISVWDVKESKTIRSTVANGYITFTVTHFSEYDIVYNAEEPEYSEQIDLVFGGESAQKKITGEYLQDQVDKSQLNESVATVEVTGVKGQEASTTYTEASVTCNTLISSNSNSWTAVSGYYYKADDGNYYPLYAQRSRSWSWGDFTYTYTYTWGYSTTSSTSNVTQIGTQSTTDTNTTPNITVYTKETTQAVEASTTITFTPVGAGTTYVTVGSYTYKIVVAKAQATKNVVIGNYTTIDLSGAHEITGNDGFAECSVAGTTMTITGVAVGTFTVTDANTIYTVSVINEDLSTVTPLEVEFWITNQQVSVESATSMTIEATVEGVHSENGVLFSVLVPGEGTQGGNTMTFWKGTVHNYDATDSVDVHDHGHQNAASGNDRTLLGHDFSYIRYWNGAWAYSSDGATWTDIDLSSNSSTANSKNDQVVAYYLQKTDVTDEVTTYVVDWGPKKANWGDLNYLGVKYVLLDYSVKYESGDEYPSSFPTANSLSFHCDTSTQNNGYYYRTLGMVRAEETDEFEVYMITVTPSDDSPANKLANTAAGNTSYSYNGTEAVAWAATQEDLNNSGLGTYESISGAYTYSIGGDPVVSGLEIYRQQGLKVTFYIRAKVTEDSLTVHYVDKTANQEFYSYNIAVKAGTEFDANIGLASPDWKANLVNGTVTNILGKTQTVSADLSTMPAIGAQYRYSDYTCVQVVRSGDGKEVYLYYTFNNAHSFVVDFGLPLTITANDLNITGEWNSASVSGAQYGTAVATIGEGVTYTPTQTLKGVETLQLTLTDSTGSVTHQIYIYPATTVYYEEGFATGSWTGGSKGSGTQSTEVPGGKHNNYGYDGKYAGETTGPSNNTQAVSSAIGEDAVFTFTGTGVDIYANCTTATGAVSILIKNSSSNAIVKLLQVNTATGAAGSATTGQNVDSYSLPIASVTDLSHGTYTVTIRHSKTNADDANSKVYLDGFRVYGTLADQSNSIYTADLEDNPTYIELRDRVLKALSVTTANSQYASDIAEYTLAQVYATGQTTEGAVVISSNTSYTSENVQDLLDNGPKNEIFLRQNESLVFNVTTAREVQIGLKAVNSAVTCTVNGQTKNISSSTDMFYSVLNKTTSGNEEVQTITIQNTGEGILSITKLKICDDPGATLGELTQEDLIPALIGMGYEPETEEPVVEYADATLTVVVNDATTTLTQNGVKGETATFTAEDIEAAAQGLVPEGYELKGQAETVTVVYGESDTVTFSAEEIPTEPEEPEESEQPTEPEEPEQPSKPANIISAVIRLFDKIFGSLKGLFR